MEGSADGLLEDLQGSGSGSGSGMGVEELLEGIGSGEEDGEEEDAIELVHVNENFFYMAHVMRLMAFLHSMTSLAMLIAYYHLKVSILTFFSGNFLGGFLFTVRFVFKFVLYTI